MLMASLSHHVITPRGFSPAEEMHPSVLPEPGQQPFRRQAEEELGEAPRLPGVHGSGCVCAS